MTSDPIELDVRSRDPVTLDVPGSAPVEWGASEYMPVVSTDAPTYEGPYEATPTSDTQVFATGRKLMVREFTVNPIPSNYGLVTWNGQTLTVS